MKSAVISAVAAACLAGAAGPALAAATSSATLGQFTITLIDLDPNDGIAPSISFLPYGAAGGPGIYGQADSYSLSPESAVFQTDTRKPGKSLSDTAQTASSGASASMTGSIAGAGVAALSASGYALTSAEASGHYYATASAPAAETREFVLSANTMVSFSALGNISASYTLGGTAAAQEGESALGVVMLGVGGFAADGESVLRDLQRRYVSLQFQIDGTVPAGPAADSWAGLLTASYSNLSNHAANGQFYAEVEAGGRSLASVAAVPEAETYTMLLGGLALLGAVVRRRRPC